MQLKDIFSALMVAFIWGLNFTVSKIGMVGEGTLPPILFSLLRSVLCASLIFIIPRPAIPWRYILGVGFLILTVKVTLLLYAVGIGFSAGLTSVVAQTQAFFTPLFAFFMFGQRPKVNQVLGIIVAFLGLYLVSTTVAGSDNLIGFFSIVVAAIFWAMANMVLQKAKGVNMLHMVVWASTVPVLPLFFINWWVLGIPASLEALKNVSSTTLLMLAYATYISIIFGYTLWGRLLRKYPAVVVAPFSLLVPVFGLFFAYFCLAEVCERRSLLGSAIIIAGLLINQLQIRRIMIFLRYKTRRPLKKLRKKIRGGASYRNP